MRRKAHELLCLTALALLLALCVGLLAGCGTGGESSFVREKNSAENAERYPYLVRTPSAVWYLAAADIEQMGEEAFFAALDRLLKDQEADFADARQALADYLPEEVPPVVIYTDFCRLSWMGGQAGFGAYYNASGKDISLFGDWESAQLSLMHEYVHYLSFSCLTVPVSEGFWAEAVAEYISRLQCENRMAREVNYGVDPNTEAKMLALGLGDGENGIDMRRVYHANAALLRSEKALGGSYFSVSGETLPMSEEQLQHPRMSNMSYYEAACILEYLLEHYGRETVFANLNCSLSHTEAVYGKSFEALCADWAEENAAICAEMGIDPSAW